MTHQFRQIDAWMTAQHRQVRYAPVTTIPNAERVDCIHFIDQALEVLANDLRVMKSSGFYRTTEPPVRLNPPADLLHSLTLLHSQVLAAHLTLGLSACAGPAIYELTNKFSPPGAGKHHEPNFSQVLKDVYHRDIE